MAQQGKKTAQPGKKKAQQGQKQQGKKKAQQGQKQRTPKKAQQGQKKAAPKTSTEKAPNTEAEKQTPVTESRYMCKTWFMKDRPMWPGWRLARLEVDVENSAVHETWSRDEVRAADARLHATTAATDIA